MHRSSPTKPLSSSISQSYPISNTPPVNENCSSPPPNYNSHIIPHNNFSPRHSQSPSLSSPPYFHNFPIPDDNDCDNSSNDSPIHKIWQSTKIYPPTPPTIKTNDIPLTSVNSIFGQSESTVKTYSCRFPPEEQITIIVSLILTILFLNNNTSSLLHINFFTPIHICTSLFNVLASRLVTFLDF